MPLPSPTEAQASDEAAWLWDRYRWLAWHRWLAVLGVTAAVLAGWWLDLVARVSSLLGMAATMALYNLAFQALRRRHPSPPAPARIRGLLFLQLSFDLVTLGLLVHLAGGIQNPASMFFAFPLALGAILLSLRGALTLCLLATALTALLSQLELRGVLPHHALLPEGLPGREAHLWREPLYAGGFLAVFALAQGGVVFFVHSVVRRLRQSEEARREREQKALTRDRLARIGEITMGLANAIRKPVHGLASALDLLRAGLRDAGPSEREALAHMEESLRRIEGILRRLLLMVRNRRDERGADLGALARNAVEMMRPEGLRRGVALVAEDTGAGAVTFDHELLSECLVHLLDNALAASPPGATVTVRSGPAPGPGRLAQVEIEDRGAGIEENHMHRIFDPFFSTKGQGTGLGLALTRQAVEEHGGRVEVASRPGLGTRVRILLPSEGRSDGS